MFRPVLLIAKNWTERKRLSFYRIVTTKTIWNVHVCRNCSAEFHSWFILRFKSTLHVWRLFRVSVARIIRQRDNVSRYYSTFIIRGERKTTNWNYVRRSKYSGNISRFMKRNFWLRYNTRYVDPKVLPVISLPRAPLKKKKKRIFGRTTTIPFKRFAQGN